jgi:membrane-bound lytic murein transglycosylase D
MARKILSAGMILLLCSGCFPRFLSEKNLAESPSVKEQQLSLFSHSELEEFFSKREPLTAVAHPVPDQSLSSNLELPISDESNDDFNLEILSGNQPKKGLDFDIPIVINEKVEYFIQYFQSTLKNRFSNWLARSEKYIPFMKNLLRETGLPEDLVYMALIESGFNPYAYSRSKASGPWQFIYLTGKRYGLKVNGWVDERRDPEKSTIAAAKYLRDLYDMFECWYLAAAGYNAGENKIAIGMKRYQTEDFWELSKYRYLKQETKDYVPQMIAAALIAKDPEKYGFIGIEYEEPLRYDKVKAPPSTDLNSIAKACEASLEELKDLNPELSRGCTPPDREDYEIKIPFGKRELFLKNVDALQPMAKLQFKAHTVRKGESLPRIARLYRVDLESLQEINRLDKASRPSAGTKLLIPASTAQVTNPPPGEKKVVNGKNSGQKAEEITYTIKKGDSLWSIANEMGVNIGVISQLNKLHPDKKLIPGDKLKIIMTAAPTPSDKPTHRKEERKIIHIVREGDTLWSIAKKYHLTVSEIKGWNNLSGRDRIHPAERLTLMVKPSNSTLY